MKKYSEPVLKLFYCGLQDVITESDPYKDDYFDDDDELF